MLREEAAYFSTRYEDAVREPDTVWQARTAEAAKAWTRCSSSPRTAAGCSASSAAFAGSIRSEVQLVSLWVDPTRAGVGVARSLIRAVASWARDRGAGGVVLFVQEANAPGRALYLRAGFRPTGDREPVGAGRPGFKLVVAATVDELLERKLAATSGFARAP